MTDSLRLEVIRADLLTPDIMGGILDLCNRAFEEDLESLFCTFLDATHVLSFLSDLDGNSGTALFLLEQMKSLCELQEMAR